MTDRTQRLLVLALTMVSMLTAQAVRMEPYSGSRIFWDTSTRKTVISGGTYGRIIQLQDGRLMAACEGDGIKIAYSQNKGNTWDAATKLVSNVNNTPNSVPDLIQLQDGTIIVAYNPRPATPYTPDRRFGIRCKRSTDNGKTWSDEIFVNDADYTFDNGCWEPSMLQLPSGEVQLYFADEGPYTNNGDQQISMCRSFDGGQTWSAPQKICYRQGHRDGMPVPVLLKDQSEIVVIIEDNGWGYGDFFPTTVRTSLQNNWNNYWVNATDQNREQTLNLSFCPRATGGAPYLRVLPWGETVMSYQSSYDHNGKLQMRTAVGNAQARDFKAMAVPFSVGANDQVLWNSLAVIDTGVVVAVGAISGNIEMIKGYPVRQLNAPYARPQLDGKQTRNEGYHTPTATQVILSTQTGTRITADFAYDRDSLYFTARVSDRTVVPNGANCDGVRLLLDVADVCDTRPQAGTFDIFIRRDGSSVVNYGYENRGAWRRATNFGMRTVTSATTTAYIVEAAIAWTALGHSAPPVGQRMAAAVECQDNRTPDVYIEKMPDVDNNASWTWMEFRLGPLPDDVGILSPTAAGASTTAGAMPLSPLFTGVGLTLVRQYTADGQVQIHKIIKKNR